MERSTILWENSLSMAIFHSFFYVYQAGSLGEKSPGFHHWFKQRQAALSRCQLWVEMTPCSVNMPQCIATCATAGRAKPYLIFGDLCMYMYIYMEVTIYKLGNKPEDIFVDIFQYPSIPDIWINHVMFVRGNYPKIALLYLIIHISGQWIIVIYPEILGGSSHLGSSLVHPSYSISGLSLVLPLMTRDITY